jgi:hypothetical protein
VALLTGASGLGSIVHPSRRYFTALSPIRRGQNNSHGALRLGSGNLLALRGGWGRKGAIHRATSSGIEFVPVCRSIPASGTRGCHRSGLLAPHSRSRGESLRVCQEHILKYRAPSGSIKFRTVLRDLLRQPSRRQGGYESGQECARSPVSICDHYRNPPLQTSRRLSRPIRSILCHTGRSGVLLVDDRSTGLPLLE